MSDTITPWSDHEVLVYILTAMEHSNVKPDYNTAPVPPGRSVSGVVQKIRGLKRLYKNEMDALKNGTAVSDPKAKGTKGKRKAEGGDSERPKKLYRAKKAVEPKQEVKQEVIPESEGMGGTEEAEEED